MEMRVSKTCLGVWRAFVHQRKGRYDEREKYLTAGGERKERRIKVGECGENTEREREIERDS